MSNVSVSGNPSLALPVAGAKVLADAAWSSNSWVKHVALMVGGAAVVGALAQLSIPLWPVPITGQTLGVIVVGAMLGARRGAGAMAVYALGGLAGIPWFADGLGGPAYVLRPSFGFIVGFIWAAWAMGRLAERRWDRGWERGAGLDRKNDFNPAEGTSRAARTGVARARALGRNLAAFGWASVIPFLVGVPWMWACLHLVAGKTLGMWATLQAGLIPFIPGGIVKAALAVVILRLAWRATGK